MFIVFEGIDGTGKSTQVKLLAKALRASGYEVVTSFEPTNGTHGSQLRASATTGRLSAEEEVELFIKDRREHVATLINPALEDGKIVILDRYYFSSMAYQGIRGLDMAEIRRKNEAFAPKPSLLIILDLPVEVSLARINARDREGDEFEKAEHLRQCREVFLSLKDESFSRLISAESSSEYIHEEVLRMVQEKLRGRNF